MRRLRSGYAVEPLHPGTLGDSTYPPDDVTYATVLPGLGLFCSEKLILDLDIAVPQRWLDVADSPSSDASRGSPHCNKSDKFLRLSCSIRVVLSGNTNHCLVAVRLPGRHVVDI